MSRNPTCLEDSLALYVENENFSSAVIAEVTGTATTSLTSDDLTNTVHRGVALYITASAVSVNTATLGVNINAKNVSTELYFPVARVSIDGIAAAGNYTGIIYPGIGTTGLPTGANAANGIIPRTFQVQTSLTISTTAGMTGTLGLRVDMCKLL